MRLRTALTEHERRRGERYPAERPTTAGAFTGDDGRLVHVGPDGTVRDCSYSLSGVGGADRLRMGITAGRGVRWFDDLTTTRQHYDGDTPLVETEYDAGRYTLHQFDLVVGDTHLTHVELRGAPPADAELVAAYASSPDMVEGSVGNLVHEGAGPDDGSVVEVYHRTEHDFLTASTGLSAAHGQRLRTIPELLGENEEGFPHRGEIDQREDSRLTPDVVVRAPFERDGRTERVTLASRAVVDRRETRETGDDAMDALTDGPDRQRRIDELSRIATAYPDADDLREAAEGRGPTVPEDAPRRGVIASDLRALDLLTAESGARIAAPEFDSFYAASGGYGYTWFRDEAETSMALLGASEELDLDADEELLATASFFCRTQDADGSWPHRVWADSGKVAPGWANARIEGANGPRDRTTSSTSPRRSSPSSPASDGRPTCPRSGASASTRRSTTRSTSSVKRRRTTGFHAAVRTAGRTRSVGSRTPARRISARSPPSPAPRSTTSSGSAPNRPRLPRFSASTTAGTPIPNGSRSVRARRAATTVPTPARSHSRVRSPSTRLYGVRASETERQTAERQWVTRRPSPTQTSSASLIA